MWHGVREAIQAAALADCFELADTLVREHNLNVCRRCAVATPVIEHRGTWPVCGTCREDLSPTKLVYRPGGAAEGNVYTDWSSLVATLKRRGITTVAFDSTCEPCVIPPGTWDVTGCTLEPAWPLPAGFDLLQPGGEKLLAHVVVTSDTTFLHPVKVYGLRLEGPCAIR